MVLEVIVAARSPVVVALDDQIVDESLAFRIGEHFACREESIFEVLDGLLAALEARKVVLTEEHHLDDDDDLFCVLLQC